MTMIFFAGLAGIIVNTAMNYRYARRIVPLGLEFDFSYMWSIVRHALPYGVALFLSVVYFKVDVILLSLMESQELADRSIALYSLPMKIIEVLMVIGGFYLNSLLPSMTSLYEEKRTQELENILVTSFKVLLSFGILFFVVGVLLREEVIRIIATPEYLSPNLVYTSADAFLVVLGAIVFYFLSLLSIYIFITVKKHTIILWINIIITLVNILGNIWLIPKFSFMGAGVVTLFSQILLFVMTYLFSRKYISFAIPGVFTLGAVVISTWIYVIGFWLLTYMSVTPLFDVVVYGGVLFGIGAYAQYQLIRRGK
ncbi:MAG: polysaccharide biosynthesis C-terminal domain-containing protein [Candidatus Peribacteria bacterium]|nr:MAG: polysaccharide biosynthesis C-terminal domain-containing protein [Candidatus Peribacteria bacterium]